MDISTDVYVHARVFLHMRLEQNCVVCVHTLLRTLLIEESVYVKKPVGMDCTPSSLQRKGGHIVQSRAHHGSYQTSVGC
jgi:hypothetical protein